MNTLRASKSSGVLSINCTTGVKSGTIDWSDGTQNPAGSAQSDLFELVIRVQNTASMSGAHTFGVNTTTDNDETTTPIDVTGPRNLTTSLSDSITITASAPVILKSLNRTTSNTLAFVDSLTILRLKIKSISDSLTFVDSLNRYKGKTKTLSDSLTISHSSYSTLTTKIRALSNTLALSVTHDRYRGRIKALSHTLAFVDSNTKLRTKIKALSDSITIVHQFQILRTKIRSLSDSLTISFSLATITNRIRSLSHTLTLVASTPSILRTKIKTLSDNLTLAHQFQTLRTKIKSLSHALTISSTHIQIRGLIRSLLSNSLTITASIPQILTTRIRTLNHSLSISITTPSFQRSLIRSLSGITLIFTNIADGIKLFRIRSLGFTLNNIITDFQRLANKNKTIAVDNLTISDNLNSNRNLIRNILTSHNLNLSDSLSKIRNLQIAFSDGFTFTHSQFTILRTKIRSINESLNISSPPSPNISTLTTRLRTLVHSISITSLSDYIKNDNTTQRSLSHPITFTDSTTKSITIRIRQISQSLTFVDITNRYRGKVKTLSDSLTIAVNLPFVKTRQLWKSISETITFTHSTFDIIKTKLRTLSNTIQITDTLTRLQGKIRTLSYIMPIFDSLSDQDVPPGAKSFFMRLFFYKKD